MKANSDLRTIARKVGFDPDYLAAFEAKLFISGPQSARRLTNFFVLLLLATVIATFGVLSDSTATVIGAMIVAPLMGPIMATAAAIVMGSGERALRSLALVAAGVAAVILLSVVLSWTVPDVRISFTDNGELASRIAPGLVALLTALASGAAGAFIMAREEIADSMGGVAIAISLVPPLCVVGIALGQGEWGPASGAFMLFLTNFLAILLAGGITFMLGGLGRIAVDAASVGTRRNAFILVVVATILVAIPLSITSYQAIDNGLETRESQVTTEAWLAGSAHRLVSALVRGGHVIVTIEGAGDAPPVTDLADRLAAVLRRPITVDLRVVPSQSASSSAAAP